MNYQRIYDDLIAAARNAPPAGYCEIHHILPRCLGGGNEQTNLIALTARQHFVAHQLLAKIYGGTLIHAANLMSNMNRYGNRRYEWLRIKYSNALKGNKHGEKTRGNKRTPEMVERLRKAQPRAQISAAMKTLWEKRRAEGYRQSPHKDPRSPEACIKISETLKGHAVSAETREKIRASVVAGLANRKPYPKNRKSRSAEAKAAVAEKLRGQTRTLETRQKIAQAVHEAAERRKAATGAAQAESYP